MLSIAIIGCGQIGSRHLQALANLQESAVIYLLDSSKESLLVSRKRFYDVLNDNNPCEFELIDSDFNLLPDKADIAIIATNSSVRFQALQDMYKYCIPKYLILEKFLFDKKDDYDNASKLIKSHKTISWVNQWISSSYPFQRIAQYFEDDIVQVDVFGNEWGLACNCIHFIDFFDYMTNYKKLVISEVNLDNKALKSKRDGYIEFTGSLSIAAENTSSIKLSSKATPYDDVINMNITSPNKSCNIMILDGKIVCRFKYEEKEWDESFRLDFQSNITNNIVQDIMLNGNTYLPYYERSSYQHKLVFDIFEKHLMNNCGQKTAGCKIT